MKANTVRINKNFFDFDNINKANFKKAGVLLTSATLRARWGFNKDTQPQSQYYRCEINDRLTFNVRKRRCEEFESTLSGYEFFTNRSDLKMATPWIKYKVAELTLRHNKSGNAYKVKIRGRCNTKTDAREGFVMEMNGTAHTKLDKKQIAEMFDDLLLMTLGDPCHYSYHSARIISCPIK